MKFYHYLTENKEVVNLINKNERNLALLKIIDILEKDCKPFLNDWKRLKTNDFLYTGRRDFTTFGKKSIRQNRRPLSTPEMMHQIFDSWFHQKFGIRARSQSLFCSFSNMIEDYGYEHFAFPIGNYKAISSSKVSDLYMDIGSYIKQNKKISLFNPATLKYDTNHFDNNELKNIIYNFLDISNYKEGLQKHDNEIMISCKDVYLMTWNDFFENALINHFK